MVGFTAALKGDLKGDMRRDFRHGRRAIHAAVKEETLYVKNAWRDQVERANLGRKLPRSIRSKVFKNRGLNAAGMVWTTAWKILRKFEHGEVIRTRGSKYLTIPTGFNRKSGRRGAPVLVTARRLARAKGSSFVARSQGGALLWWMRVRKSRVQETRFTGRVETFVGSRKIRARRRHNLALKYGAIPMFVLVKKTRHSKRLTFEAIGRRAFNRLPLTISRHWKD